MNHAGSSDVGMGMMMSGGNAAGRRSGGILFFVDINNGTVYKDGSSNKNTMNNSLCLLVIDRMVDMARTNSANHAKELLGDLQKYMKDLENDWLNLAALEYAIDRYFLMYPNYCTYYTKDTFKKDIQNGEYSFGNVDQLKSEFYGYIETFKQPYKEQKESEERNVKHW